MRYKTVVREIKAEKIRQYFYKKCIGEINKIFFFLLSVLKGLTYILGFPSTFMIILCAAKKVSFVTVLLQTAFE